jgi:hypothetical protein
LVPVLTRLCNKQTLLTCLLTLAAGWRADGAVQYQAKPEPLQKRQQERFSCFESATQRGLRRLCPQSLQGVTHRAATLLSKAKLAITMKNSEYIDRVYFRRLVLDAIAIETIHSSLPFLPSALVSAFRTHTAHTVYRVPRAL